MGLAIDFSGRTAWVTGGASGIGAAIARRFAEAGARVVSLDRSHETRPDYAAAMVSIALDIRDSGAVAAVAADLLARGFGADVLVNNAGLTHDGVVWRLSDEDWSDVIDVNLNGTFRLTRACAPEMRRRRSGAIVNIASINALRGKFGQSNYAASKAGIIGFTKAVARELGREGIRVNAIAPGFIDTPLTAALPADVLAQADREKLLPRRGVPDDVANAALFLASPLAAHITGQVLVVDGGQLL